MPQPTPYDREFSFTNFQTANPTATLPADQLDAELNSVKQTLDGVLANIELIQRDDGALANLSVGLEQLAAEVQVGISAPRVWTTATAYKTSPVDNVFQGSGFYRCLIAHTSGVFATDLAAGKWELIVNLAGVPLVNASQIAVTPTGGISAVTVQAALAELDSEKAVTSHTHVATQISDSSAIGRSILTAADAAAVVALLPVLPPGAVVPYAGTSAPTGWLLCGGQAISRAANAALFAIIGTTFGAGDLSTTFNVPNLQGRVVAGKDNMSGVSGNNLTNQPGGLDGDVLGATGGLENHALTTAQLALHAHTGTTADDGLHGHPYRADTQANGNSDGTGGLMLNSDTNSNQAAFTGTPDATLGHQIGGAGLHHHTITTDSTGSGTAHNNVQPTIILNYIIKT